MTLVLALLLGCPAEQEVRPAEAPPPRTAPGPAPIPLEVLGTPLPIEAPPPVTRPTVIPRDPWAEPVQFTNNPPRCTEFGALAPAPKEDGHWGAAKLVPIETPFRVERVEVVLAHGTFNMSSCDATQRYLLRVYAVSADAPPPDGAGTDPATDYEFDFFQIREQEGDRTLSAQITPPITLEKGQALIVAVDTHNAGTGARTCIRTCLNGVANDRTFWSNARAPAEWKWSVYRPSRGSGMWAIAEGFGP